jgi:hypothetical protein
VTVLSRPRAVRVYQGHACTFMQGKRVFQSLTLIVVDPQFGCQPPPPTPRTPLLVWHNRILHLASADNTFRQYVSFGRAFLQGEPVEPSFRTLIMSQNLLKVLHQALMLQDSDGNAEAEVRNPAEMTMLTARPCMNRLLHREKLGYSLYDSK